nr:hypothetical protein [Tanacetum cinerariifolium]
MDLFSLIRTPNPTKVKVGSRPRALHEVPLLTLTANRVIEMDDPATAFEQEAKLLRKSVAQVARRDKRIEARELEIKKLEALLETEAEIKRAAEDKSAGLIKELEDMRARFSDLQVSHEHLSQQVAS